MKILFCFFFIVSFVLSFDFSKIDNIKAEFKQKVTSDNNIVEYQGNFIATKQNQYFEYQKPIKKQVFIDDKTTIIYEPNLNQAVFLSTNNKQGILNILNNAKQAEDKIISNINGDTFFIFLDSNDIPTKIEYIDKLDNKNEILLDNVKINTNIDRSIFVFNAPEGTDIIHSNSSIFNP